MPNDEINLDASELDDNLNDPSASLDEDFDEPADEGKTGEPDGDDPEKGSDEEEEGEGETEDDVTLTPEDEDEELAESAPVNLSVFNKKYPNLFKEHPELKAAVIREQRFTEVFPTIEDAQEAYEKAESFTNFQHELASGQSENLLRNINKLDPRAFDKFTGGFLQTIKKLSPNHYNAVMGPEIGDVIKRVYKTAGKHNDENLAKACQYLSAYIFDEVDPDKLESPKEPDNRKEQDSRELSERQKWEREKANDAMDNVQEQVVTTLMKDITNGLDPHGKLNEVTREALAERVQKEIDKVLAKDPRHNKTMRLLWERASKAGYPAEWRNKIRNAYLANARRILPEIRTRVKAKALKGTPSGNVKDTKLSSGKPVSGNKSNQNNGSKGSPKGRQIDWDRTTDKDYFEGKITYKK